MKNIKKKLYGYINNRRNYGIILILYKVCNIKVIKNM